MHPPERVGAWLYLERGIQLDLFIASLAVATLFPIILFLIFQRMFLSGGGLSGAIKG